MGSIVIAIVLLSGQSSRAATGSVYPDTARVSCSFETTGDTVVVQLTNQSATAVQQFVFTHHSISNASLTQCIVDGVTKSSVSTETEYGTVTSGWYSVRWLIGSFSQTVVLKYYSAASSGGYFNFSAAHPYPLFGIGDVTCQACCCTGIRGNVNATGVIDLSDLSSLVSYLTGGGYVLPCPEAANVNGTGIVDLSDLSSLASYLTGGGYTLPSCP